MPQSKSKKPLFSNRGHLAFTLGEGGRTSRPISTEVYRPVPSLVWWKGSPWRLLHDAHSLMSPPGRDQKSLFFLIAPVYRGRGLCIKGAVPVEIPRPPPCLKCCSKTLISFTMTLTTTISPGTLAIDHSTLEMAAIWPCWGREYACRPRPISTEIDQPGASAVWWK